MGNARNSHKDVSRAGKVASQANEQPHGRSNFDQDASQAGRHTASLKRVEAQHQKAFTSDVRKG
jgi:hypothetical protein